MPTRKSWSKKRYKSTNPVLNDLDTVNVEYVRQIQIPELTVEQCEAYIRLADKCLDLIQEQRKIAEKEGDKELERELSARYSAALSLANGYDIIKKALPMVLTVGDIVPTKTPF